MPQGKNIAPSDFGASRTEILESRCPRFDLLLISARLALVLDPKFVKVEGSRATMQRLRLVSKRRAGKPYDYASGRQHGQQGLRQGSHQWQPCLGTSVDQGEVGDHRSQLADHHPIISRFRLSPISQHESRRVMSILSEDAS